MPPSVDQSSTKGGTLPLKITKLILFFGSVILSWQCLAQDQSHQGEKNENENTVSEPPTMTIPVNGQAAKLTYLIQIKEFKIKSAQSKIYFDPAKESKKENPDSPYFPLYSLWEYQLSKYGTEHPGKILNYVEIPQRVPEPAPAHRNFAPLIMLDLNNSPTVIDATIEGRHLWHESGPLAGSYTLLDKPILIRKKLKPLNAKDDFWMYSAQDSEGYSAYSFEIYGTGLITPDTEYPIDIQKVIKPPKLDPTQPDILTVHSGLEPSPLNNYVGQIFETGDNTKIFVGPTIMTTLSLSPRGLPKNVRATMKAYSRNWKTDQDHYSELTESALGSRRFVSNDGKVIYEIGHVIDEFGKVVDQPTMNSIDDLFIYITDPAISLDHAPNFVHEHGSDTGQYRDWSRPYQGSNATFPWSQVEKESQQAQFNVEVSNVLLPPGQYLRFIWTGGDGKKHEAADPLVEIGHGRYRTTLPLLAFTDLGPEIGRSWRPTSNVITPQIPGVMTFRYMNLKIDIGTPQFIEPETVVTPSEIEAGADSNLSSHGKSSSPIWLKVLYYLLMLPKWLLIGAIIFIVAIIGSIIAVRRR